MSDSLVQPISETFTFYPPGSKAWSVLLCDFSPMPIIVESVVIDIGNSGKRVIRHIVESVEGTNPQCLSFPENPPIFSDEASAKNYRQERIEHLKESLREKGRETPSS
jgi:hypothetical protein